MCITVNPSIHGLAGNLSQEHYCMHIMLWDVISSDAFIQGLPVNQLIFWISLIGPGGKIDKETDKMLIDCDVFMQLIANFWNMCETEVKISDLMQQKKFKFVNTINFNTMFQQ
jgi:hypothetical protein